MNEQKKMSWGTHCQIQSYIQWLGLFSMLPVYRHIGQQQML